MTIKVQSDYLTAKANSVCDVTCFMFEHSMLKSKKEKKKEGLKRASLSCYYRKSMKDEAEQME